jgi:hypothetical protein
MADCIEGLMATLCATIVIGSDVCGLIFGILMLIPSSPFHDQYISWGVVLIVLSVTSILGIVVFLGLCAALIVVSAPFMIVDLVVSKIKECCHDDSTREHVTIDEPVV